MHLLKNLGMSLALSLSVLSVAHADATMTITSTGTDQYAYRNPLDFEIGRVTLEYGTQSITALTTSTTLVDQGWGDQDPNNGLHVKLLSNNNVVYSVDVAGSTHDWQTVTFDLAYRPDVYTALNSALAAIDRSAGPIQLELATFTLPWVGWELHTRNDALSVTTSLQPASPVLVPAPVPEPETYAMLLLGLGAIVLVRRRKQGTAA